MSVDRTAQNLADALAQVTNEITKADTKSGLLLTLDGLLVAALSLMGSGGGSASLALQALGGLALTLSVLLAVTVIRPRLAAPGGARDGWSFVTFATASADDIAASMQEDRRTIRLQVLSRIALRKMKIQRAAGDATVIATVAIAAAAILTRT